MKYLLAIIALILFSGCIGNSELEHTAIYTWKGTVKDTFVKKECFIQDKNGITHFKSELIMSGETNTRLIRIHIEDLKVGNEVIYELENDRQIVRVLDKKEFEFQGEKHEIVKIYYKDGYATDNDSNKFYIKNYGIILETFWKRNTIESIKIEGRDNELIARAIKEIKRDEDFMWNYVNNN